MRRTFSTLPFACLLLAVGLSCSGKRGPQVGGETHWLEVCTQDEDCGAADLSCVCGTCTRACSGDAACAGGTEAACFDVDSPLLLQRCEDRASDDSQGLCLMRCTSDTECGSERTCIQRVCVPALMSDAGASGTSASGQGEVRISDFDGVSDSVSWTDAVAVPAPQLAIAGADERIIGTWREANCDPSQTGTFGPSACMRLVIEQSASGDVSGSASFDRTADLHGPFPPPQDPNVGYPTEVDVTKYGDLVGAPGIPYRILDGRFENDRLTFAFSSFDLWHSWCRLQTSYPWQIGDHAFHFCAPQDAAAQAGIDEGKIVLCTSADFEPLCSNDRGESYPCSCMSADGPLNPRCSPAYCHCDSQACDANLQSDQQHVNLTLEADHLVGTWSDWLFDQFPINLERVSP